MRTVILALVLTLGIQGITTACKQSPQEIDEYEADQKAYQECIENEPSMDDCTFNYVKYLPEEYQEQLED